MVASLNQAMKSARLTEASRVTVLMYHRIGEASNDWERRFSVSPQRFAEHMRALQAHGMRPCPVGDFVAWLEGAGTLCQGSFVLTFDDGYLGVYEHAFPRLSQMGWPATVFLVSDLIGRVDTWTARENPSGRTYPLLGRGEIEAMARGGFSFQSHSRGHPDLRHLARPQLLEELAGARRDLEDLLGRPVPYLAYPFGRYDENVLEATKACGYAAAFSVQPGFNRRDVDRYRIRRLDVYGTDSAAALMRKISLGSNDGSWWQSVRYYADRIVDRIR
jgi:peptidoglycan/xylan/chitin deacetylase (PgdA/CDA1 family)